MSRCAAIFVPLLILTGVGTARADDGGKPAIAVFHDAVVSPSCGASGCGCGPTCSTCSNCSIADWRSSLQMHRAKLKAWAHYQPLKNECSNKHETTTICSPPLYQYFLNDCKSCPRQEEPTPCDCGGHHWLHLGLFSH